MSSGSESEDIDEVDEVDGILDGELESDSNNGRKMIDSEEIDDTERVTMKGDTVGDTLYSGKWIINTLVSLTKVNTRGWSEELETNLCMLWDMTAEKDVVEYLMENEFLRMAEYTLETTEEPRLTEIILGILGNMCCHSSVLQSVGASEDMVSTIFNILSTNDSETLIQALRLLQASVWDIQGNPKSKWLENFKGCDSFPKTATFILKSATNEDLLIAATDLLHSISALRLPDEESLLATLFNVEELIPALIECFTQVVQNKDEGHSQSELKIIENWLAIVSNIMRMELLKFIESSTENDENYDKIMNISLRILRPYVYTYNLIPIEEQIALCIHECVDMLLSFQRNEMFIAPEINSVIVTIIYRLRSAIDGQSKHEMEMDPDDTMKELLRYLENYWMEILSFYGKSDLIDMFYFCESSVTNCLKEITKTHEKTSESNFAKLLEVHAVIETME